MCSGSWKKTPRLCFVCKAVNSSRAPFPFVSTQLTNPWLRWLLSFQNKGWVENMWAQRERRKRTMYWNHSLHSPKLRQIPSFFLDRMILHWKTRSTGQAENTEATINRKITKHQSKAQLSGIRSNSSKQTNYKTGKFLHSFIVMSTMHIIRANTKTRQDKVR